MQKWERKSATEYELVPDGSSRFVLFVRRDQAGTWRAFVSGSEVDDGAAFVSLTTAQAAAMAAYLNYWADFEDPWDE